MVQKKQRVNNLTLPLFASFYLFLPLCTSSYRFSPLSSSIRCIETERRRAKGKRMVPKAVTVINESNGFQYHSSNPSSGEPLGSSTPFDFSSFSPFSPHLPSFYLFSSLLIACHCTLYNIFIQPLACLFVRLFVCSSSHMPSKS